MTLRFTALFAAACAATLVAQSRPQVSPAAAPIYQRLLPQIEAIKLFDHHAHPAFPADAGLVAAQTARRQSGDERGGSRALRLSVPRHERGACEVAGRSQGGAEKA